MMTVCSTLVAVVMVPVLLEFYSLVKELLVPVLSSLFIVLTSSATPVWFRRITTREDLARDAAKVPRGGIPAAASR